VGVIGSDTKRARFVSRLRADGLDPSRLTCPIGLPGLTGKHPGEIAVSVAAQLISQAEVTAIVAEAKIVSDNNCLGCAAPCIETAP
jgi:xanthine dehydrogenase accessory factor